MNAFKVFWTNMGYYSQEEFGTLAEALAYDVKDLSLTDKAFIPLGISDVKNTWSIPALERTQRLHFAPLLLQQRLPQTAQDLAQRVGLSKSRTGEQLQRRERDDEEAGVHDGEWSLAERRKIEIRNSNI